MKSIFLSALFCMLMACGSGTTTTTTSSDPLADNDWRLISSRVDGGLEFNGSSSTLTIINNDDSELPTPTLHLYDLSTGEYSELTVNSNTSLLENNDLLSSEIASSSTFTGIVLFPGDTAPADTSLIELAFDGSPEGIFFTADVFAAMSPAIINPSASFSSNPNPGNWNFTMQLGTEYLSGSNCPSGSVGFSTTGDADLFVSSNGEMFTMSIDGEIINFDLTSTSSGLYESPEYVFALASDPVTYGTNEYELTVSGQTNLDGHLKWDNNQGCTASYPISLDFESLSSPNLIALCEVSWTVDYVTPLVCGNSVISPALMTNLVYATANVDVTYAGADPVMLTLDSFFGDATLMHMGNNMYGNFMPNQVLGTTPDYLGMPLTLVGGYQFFAISSTQMVGYLNLLGFGANPCSSAVQVTLTASSSC